MLRYSSISTSSTSFLGAVLALAAAGACILAATTLHAGPHRGHQRDKKKAAMQEDLLPHKDVVSPKVMERDYANMRVTPYNDPKFYFEVAVPRTFDNQPVQVTRKELAEDNKSPLPMAEFRPQSDKTVLIEARYVRVPERVSLDRFMQVYVEQSGFQFVKRQRGDYNGRQVEDALLRIESPSLGKTLTRVTVSRRGDLVFLIAGSCREQDYAKWKQAFAVAALSFSPTGK